MATSSALLPIPCPLSQLALAAGIPWTWARYAPGRTSTLTLRLPPRARASTTALRFDYAGTCRSFSPNSASTGQWTLARSVAGS